MNSVNLKLPKEIPSNTVYLTDEKLNHYINKIVFDDLTKDNACKTKNNNEYINIYGPLLVIQSELTDILKHIKAEDPEEFAKNIYKGKPKATTESTDDDVKKKPAKKTKTNETEEEIASNKKKEVDMKKLIKKYYKIANGLIGSIEKQTELGDSKLNEITILIGLEKVISGSVATNNQQTYGFYKSLNNRFDLFDKNKLNIDIESIFDDLLSVLVKYISDANMKKIKSETTVKKEPAAKKTSKQHDNGYLLKAAKKNLEQKQNTTSSSESETEESNEQEDSGYMSANKSNNKTNGSSNKKTESRPSNKSDKSSGTSYNKYLLKEDHVISDSD
jgi:hypothetical protein